MIVNSNDVWVGASLEKYGEFSEFEVEIFKKVITQNMCVADVGANIGAHTVVFSNLVGNNGSVFAFEPERHNFYTLCGNIAVNNLHNTYCFNEAIGNEKKQVMVPEISFGSKGNYGGLSLLEDHSKKDYYPVKMAKLDDYNLFKLDFLKIDVEGMELEVLQGATKTIQKHKPFLYVENDRSERSDSLIDYLKENKYEIYRHLPYLFNPNNYNNDAENLFVGQAPDGQKVNYISSNVFCHHQSVDCPVNVDEFRLEKL